MRNRLVHVYFNIDLPLVWDTVCNDLPFLIAQLETLVPPEGGYCWPSPRNGSSSKVRN